MEEIVDDDGFATVKSRKGFTWTYTTDGGALFQGPLWYKTKGEALAAGQEWRAEYAR